MRIYISFMTFCLFALSIQANDLSMERLAELQGKAYLNQRDMILKKKIHSLKNYTEEIFILTEILQTRQQYPELFKKLPGVIQKRYHAYKKYTRPNFPQEPRMWIKPIQFMRQGGAEQKIYFTPKFSNKSSEYINVKHVQTDEQMRKAKTINRAARFAVIEYLWKLSKHWRVEYELLDIFYERSKGGILEKRLLPVFEDVFKRSNHFMVLEICLQIFLNEKHKIPLPLMRKKLNHCFEKQNYKSCNVIIPFLQKQGNLSDLKKTEQLKPKLKKLKEEMETKIDKQRQKIEKEKEKKELEELDEIIM